MPHLSADRERLRIYFTQGNLNEIGDEVLYCLQYSDHDATVICYECTESGEPLYLYKCSPDQAQTVLVIAYYAYGNASLNMFYQPFLDSLVKQKLAGVTNINTSCIN